MKMASKVKLYPHYLVIDIDKAMYRHANYGIIRLDEKWVKFAVHNFVNIVIRTPEGEKVFMPKEIKRDGKKVKEEFLIKGVPMVMFEIAIPDREKSDTDRWAFS